MRRLASLLGLTAGLLAATCAWAAEVKPRPAVEGVAKAIADNYYDAAKGAAVAGQLRAEAARGAYDRLTDPRDLATALSERLRPLDHHFAVTWSPTPPPQNATPGAAPPPRVSAAAPADPQRRANYGVRRVEILGGNLGYIDLRFFADFAFDDPNTPARKAIEAALQTVANTDAVIIDLRDNGGGSPAMVGYLSSAFTVKGADIYNRFQFRDRTESEAPKDWYPAPRLDTPLYILISARTGSAAEAFAYTLKNAKRAVVVGEASAGAANPGGFIPTTDGFAIFVSTGSPISPITKTNWEGDGVAPDVQVPAAQALPAARALALEAVLKTPAGAVSQETRWALEAIRAESRPPPATGLTDYEGAYGAIEVAAVEGRLTLKRGRRTPTVLLPLGGETYTVADEPGRRVLFERDAKGAVIAFEMLNADGGGARYRRGAPQG